MASAGHPPPTQTDGSTEQHFIRPTVSAVNSDPTGRPKKNRPKDTKLRQQKLPAWQPILTASSVIPAIFAIGVVFLPIGVALFLASDGVQEVEVDYTNCETPSAIPCRVKIFLEKAFEGDVYFYYGLYNYYQNLRRYMKSRSDAQLIGDLQNVGDCAPYAYLNTSTGQQKVIAPCGAVANSMFNGGEVAASTTTRFLLEEGIYECGITFAFFNFSTDTFKLYREGSNTPVPWTYKGIVWPVDKERKFRNPPGPSLQEAFANTVKPPNWQTEVWRLDPLDPDNNGFLNSDFIVWMRTAALPNFRKLYRILVRNDTQSQGFYSGGLPAGTYHLDVMSNYPVTVFGGRKSFIISTTSWAGGKNPFLGIAYMVVGSVCIVLGFVFLFIHLKFGTRFSDMANISQSSRQ